MTVVRGWSQEELVRFLEDKLRLQSWVGSEIEPYGWISREVAEELVRRIKEAGGKRP